MNETSQALYFRHVYLSLTVFHTQLPLCVFRQEKQCERSPIVAVRTRWCPLTAWQLNPAKDNQLLLIKRQGHNLYWERGRCDLVSGTSLNSVLKLSRCQNPEKRWVHKNVYVLVCPHLLSWAQSNQSGGSSICSVGVFPRGFSSEATFCSSCPHPHGWWRLLGPTWQVTETQKHTLFIFCM